MQAYVCTCVCVCMCESSLHDKITEKVQPECNFVFVEELQRDFVDQCSTPVASVIRYAFVMGKFKYSMFDSASLPHSSCKHMELLHLFNLC